MMALPLARAEARPARAGSLDPVLAAVVIALIGFGVVMVYSASAIEAGVQLKDSQFYLKRQAMYAGVGLCLMWLMSRVDYHRYR
ncbi:MAG TPA: FtsW/RodA/SpoVE family cell cycle protein, partial [Polyangiaceae bacterium]